MGKRGPGRPAVMAKRNDEICNRIANGESCSVLAEEYGLSRQRVHQIALDHFKGDSIVDIKREGRERHVKKAMDRCLNGDSAESVAKDMSLTKKECGELSKVLRKKERSERKKYDSKVVSMHTQGATYNEIAEKLGLSYVDVRNSIARCARSSGEKYVLSRDNIKERDQAIVKDFRCKMTVAALAEKYGLSQNGILLILERNGARKRCSKGLTPHARHQGEAVFSMLKHGMTQQEIAKVLGTSQSRISQIIATCRKEGLFEETR